MPASTRQQAGDEERAATATQHETLFLKRVSCCARGYAKRFYDKAHRRTRTRIILQGHSLRHDHGALNLECDQHTYARIWGFSKQSVIALDAD
jgi:hypothetical protein